MGILNYFFENDEKAEYFIGKANFCISRLDFKTAINFYNKAIKANPNSYRAYGFRGFAKTYLDDYQGAILDCTKAIQLNPHYKEAFIFRGDAKKATNDLSGALVDLNKAIAIDPDDKEAYYLRGLVLIKLGEKEKGLEDLIIASDKGHSLAKFKIEDYQ